MVADRSYRVLWQIAIVLGLTIFAKAAAFAKDVLLSFQFGAGPATDAYFIANTIPSFVFSGVFVTIGLVFLPIYQRSLLESNHRAAETIHTAAISYSLLSLVLSLATIVTAPQLVHLIAPSSSVPVQEAAAVMTRVLACGFVFSGWVGLQNALSQAHKSFVWPQIVPLANHLVVILGLIIAYHIDGNIVLLPLSALIGWVLLAPVMTLTIRRSYPRFAHVTFSPTLLKQLVILSVPVFFGLSLDQINNVIDIFIGSSFGAGAVSHLTYASRIMMLFSGIFGIIISYFIFPYLTDSVQKSDHSTTQRYISRGVIAVISLTLPLGLTSIFLAPQIISAAFQRGEFTPADAEASALALQYFSLGIVFIGLREVLNRIFLARQATVHLLVFGMIGAAVNLIASLYFSRFLGVGGIALGTAMGSIAYVFSQVVALQRTPYRLLSTMLWPVPIVIIIAGVAFTLVIVNAPILQLDSNVAQLIMAMVSGGAIYFAILALGALTLRKRLRTEFW